MRLDLHQIFLTMGEAMNKIIVILILLVCALAKTFGQSDISGFVYDNESGESLIGANVFIKEVSSGASSNISGYFVISNIPAGTYTLITSYVGYQSKTEKIKVPENKNLELEIRLSPSTIETDEVVVTTQSEEIAVNLFSKPISTVELTATKIFSRPDFIEPDLLRVLQTIPGVTAANDFSAGVYVRGGTPDQNLFLIDGSDVYNPDHFFGIFSTFNTDAIKKVDFYKGGYGAEYGGRLSSLVNIINLDGNREKIKGAFNVSFLTGSGNLQVPLGKLGSISGSFRRTYLELFKNMSDNDEIPDYHFWDGNIKTFLDLGKNDKLSISVFRGLDNLNIEENSVEGVPRILYEFGNITGSVNWKHIFGTKLFSNFLVTGSRFMSDFDLPAFGIREDNDLDDVTFKASLEYYANQNLTFRLGGEYKNVDQKFDSKTNTEQILFKNTAKLTSAYLSTNWKPNPLWDIELGIRGSYYKSNYNDTKIAPRFSVKYRLSETMNAKFNTGVFYQYVNRFERQFFNAIWAVSDKNTPISNSVHFIGGIQKVFGNSIELDAEVFYKTYKDISQNNFYVANDIKATGFSDGRVLFTDPSGAFLTGDGKSLGFEIGLRKNTGSVTGSINYTYSKTEYKFNRLNNGNDFSPRHDRNHSINADLTTDITDVLNSINFGLFDHFDKDESVTLNLYSIFSSGQPITVPTSSYYVNFSPDWQDYQSLALYPGEINSFRLPNYFRLDLSLAYTNKHENFDIQFFIKVYNATNRKNIWFVSYRNEDKADVPEITSIGNLPIIPSFGFRLTF